MRHETATLSDIHNTATDCADSASEANATPQAFYLVHDAAGKKRGQHEHAEDAAQQIASHLGWTIRSNRRTLWVEGSESQSAAESFDHVAEVVYARETGFAIIATIPQQ